MPDPFVKGREPVWSKEPARLLAGASLFIVVYLGTFLPLAFASAAIGARSHYWIALVSATFSTWATVRVMERGEWSIGFLVAPKLAGREMAFGLAFAAAVIGLCDGLILAVTNLRHVRGSGAPWLELAVIFVPAAVQEEVVFRGYVFQRIRRWNRGVAIVLTSAVFAFLHGANEGITVIAFANLALAGVLLAIAYERYGRLWFPIGIHLGWNILSGPVLGYGVSGFQAGSTLVRTIGSAPSWLSGGTFGVEGSAAMTAVEVVAIAVLAITRRRPAVGGPWPAL
jgi:membrane protease YdiL (CAAX protease family)